MSDSFTGKLACVLGREGQSVSRDVLLDDVRALRAVVEAARALMLAEPPCHCGEMAPGPCCEACRRERALRDALAKLDDR